MTIGGTNSADFTLDTDADATIQGGEESTFTITFDPSATGLRQANISIDNNDADEDPYTFDIQGTGTGPAAEMDVLGNGISIPDGDTSPTTADQTDFGTVPVSNGQVTYTFSIQNTGSADLNLTDSPAVTIGGTNAADFSLTTDAPALIAAGDTDTFSITFDPGNAGLRQATISIANDDNDEAPYNFSIQGTGGSGTTGGQDAIHPVRKFSTGPDGGAFKINSVIVNIPKSTIPNGSSLTMKRLTRENKDAAGFTLGDEIYDITIIGSDGRPITSFSPPIQLCIKPSSAQLKKAGNFYGNLNVFSSNGSGSWYAVPNPYEQDGFVCVDINHFSLYAVAAGDLPATGFAPGTTEVLPVQPESKAYWDLDSFSLDIPKLGLYMPVVGVPLTGTGWDVTWLGDQAGYLEGTAFPTWEGNTAITAHVWDANNQPGPFVDLHTLQYGDRVSLQAFGQRFIYEVRQTQKVRADDLKALPHEDIDVLTLITCQGYNAVRGDYDWRYAVKAVLVEVSPE